MAALRLRRLFGARFPAADLDLETSFACPMHLDRRSYGPGRCSICYMTLERTQARSAWTVAHAASADDRDTRLARLALPIGVLGALALAGITLLRRAEMVPIPRR